MMAVCLLPKLSYVERLMQCPATREHRASRPPVGTGPPPTAAPMLRAVGLMDEDFDKPASLARRFAVQAEITPCNSHLDRLARKGCEGIRTGGGVPQIFGAPTATDGIMMGHRQGMRHSAFVSREVIADSLEVVAGG